MNELPYLSVIIPTYNEEKRLPYCLQSIRNQDYPQKKIEILIIDDDSTDNTVNIASKFGCRILRNGEHNIERGKSIGLENASYEYVFFIDADNALPNNTWLKDLVSAYVSNPNCFGGESLYFEYRENHSIADRYCELFGINDPLVFYLKKQDKLMWVENKWRLGGKIIKETPNYYLIQFNEKDLPTLGSQGFVTKKTLLKSISWRPYLYHMDSQLELIRKNKNGNYILMKNGIVHLHSQTVAALIKKLRRNINLFHEHNNIRRFKYNLNFFKILFVALLMVTVVRPFYDGLKGFSKKRDIAWFLHPLLSMLVPIMYGFETIRHKIGGR